MRKKLRENLAFALIVVCIFAIPISFLVSQRENSATNQRVTKIESPCLRYGAKSHQCREAFEDAVRTITRREACEILSKTGLTPGRCKPKGGDASQTPHNTAHQQRSPQSGGGSEEVGPTTQPEPAATPEPEPHPITEVVHGLTESVTETACSVARVAPVCTSPASGG